MEDLRQQTFDKTYKMLKDFDSTDEAANVKMLYFYRMQAEEEYKLMSKEIAEEYRSGKVDPSREVGRIEKSRSGVKKLI
jgi:hypothetical protein